MKAKLHQIKNHPVWAAKFFCPIDKKWSFVKKNSKEESFGIARSVMGGIPAILCNVDWKNLEVIENKFKGGKKKVVASIKFCANIEQFKFTLMKTFRITGSMSGYLSLDKIIQAENKKAAKIEAVNKWSELNDINYDDQDEEDRPSLNDQINFWGIKVKEIKDNKKPYAYKIRNYPCIVNGNKMPYHVSGSSLDFGSGVLEWCFSQEDADDILIRMKRDDRFFNLSVRKTSES